jgi:hypothetical protein
MASRRSGVRIPPAPPFLKFSDAVFPAWLLERDVSFSARFQFRQTPFFAAIFVARCAHAAHHEKKCAPRDFLRAAYI